VSTQLSAEWCYETLRQVRWPTGIVCPRCGRGHVTTHSKSVRTPWRRYLCLSCRRTFTDLTGTPFARTNVPVTKWFLCLRLLRRHQTTAELARRLGVKWETAADLQRRLVVALARPGFLADLNDVVASAEDV
jgi:transposase-like protein